MFSIDEAIADLDQVEQKVRALAKRRAANPLIKEVGNSGTKIGTMVELMARQANGDAVAVGWRPRLP